MRPLALSALSTVNALGIGLDVTARGLRENRSGLRFCDYEDARLDTYIGRVDGVEEAPVEGAQARYDCRNNRLAQMALRADGFADAVAAAAGRYGTDRIALILGTSTSGLREGERAFARRAPGTSALPAEFRFTETQDHHSLAAFVQGYLGLRGPVATVSTACSSSAKVFADAAQLIDAGICDAAVVGGADSLCLLTLYGFKSLELTADAPCCPNDAARSGISIGEAAGFALLERAEAAAGGAVALLLGYGESADAYHMSAPHPEGLGAELAMRRALEAAGLAPGDVDYINEHGTGSRQNDQVEDAAIARVFGDGMRSSSTKGATGHTLGAAGILEIAICCLAMRHGFIPGNVNLRALDPAFRCRVEAATAAGAVRRALNNSFGFGGSNCSILLGQAPMIEARIAGIGLFGPGLPDWPTARRVLSGAADYAPGDVVPPVPDGLSPRERRRTSFAVRLALAAAAEAVRDAHEDAARLPTVFGWAHGDGVIVQRLLETLATPERYVSPTDFHNSVHNVAVGYWAIASGSHEPCSSIAAAMDTYPASLLKALAEVHCAGRSVLHIACEAPFDEPLYSACPTGAPLALAMVLTPPQEAGGIARIRADYRADGGNVTKPATAALRPLWELNPAARAFPLLEAVARACAAAQTMAIPYGPEGRLHVTVAPC